MSTLPRIVDVEALGGYVLRLTFSDGVVRELDFAPTVSVGVLRALADPKTFAAVTVDRTTGTVAWPGGIDLDPDVLYGGIATDVDFAPRVVRDTRAQSTA